MQHSGHRKRIRRYHEPGHFHELTFSCFQRRPLLADAHRCGFLSERIKAAMTRWQFQLHAFVFMPEHVHLLVSPELGNNTPRFDNLLKSVKRMTSLQVKQRLIEDQDALPQDLTVIERSVQVFRFWQNGPGYDRNLLSAESVLASLHYIHENPVKRGLCNQPQDYRWSSAKFYASDGQQHDVELPTVSLLPAELLD